MKPEISGESFRRFTNAELLARTLKSQVRRLQKRGRDEADEVGSDVLEEGLIETDKIISERKVRVLRTAVREMIADRSRSHPLVLRGRGFSVVFFRYGE